MRLADLQVRHRIIALAAVPLTAAVLLTVPLATERVQSARESTQSAKELRLARQVGDLIADLQRERLYSSAYLATPDGDGNPIVQQASQTDADVSDFREDWLGLGAPAALTAAFREASDLDRTRRLVLQRALTAADVNTRYGSAISALLDALPSSGTGQGNGRGTFGREQATVEELLRVHESSSSFGALLLTVVSEPGEGQQLMADVASSMATADTERRRFLRDASPSQVDLFQKVESGGAAAKIKTYADALTLWAYANPHGTAQRSDLPDGVTPSRIFAASDSLDQLRLLVQNKIARDSAAAASDNASEAGRWALAFIMAVLALTITMVWLMVWIARSIARPLRLLHGAAEQVAQAAEDELTRVAEETAGSSSGQTPVRIRRVPTLTKDELGQLAVAFNRVQDAAVGLIERQVRSRDNAAAMLGNVGRRTQNLAALQLSMIDSMERSEADPAVLERLYRLDHVSSRLRRYANSLVVLSGWTEPVLASSPVPLGELTRSALGNIEGFSRVRLGDIPPLLVSAHVAGDLALVIAELLDNATSFSPPAAPVEVSAEALPGGLCLIQIVDQGVGMTDSRLADENARLVRKERLDLVSTDFLGLFVVGRLSRRHHFQVRLERTRNRGVTARVLLPAGVFHIAADAAGDREPTAGMAQPLALAAAPEIRPTVPRQPTEADAERHLGGTPSPSVDSLTEEQPVTVEGINPDTRRVASLARSSRGPFDWFEAEQGGGIEPVLNQGVTAAKTAGERGVRTLQPGPGLMPERLPVRRARRATAQPLPPTGESASAVVLPLAQRPEGGASNSARLVRRVPGAQMPAGSFVPNAGHLESDHMDPEAARAMIEEFEAGIARASQSRPSPEGD
ncbi:nitrate- and nitrite sensing domain-containing protein [Streptomyces sp. NPDC057717]|uniref:sensor histidine kinase n=1 Tax=Streptomyces sp. NPDC057717 TaxID=3346224 RepID=UPI00368C6A5F